ncbi:NAD-dependent epimerase/dehydratase family protein [bacterium]|nr:NAD-dependent epimerase/dehydratase family protein [bacterium]
MKIFMTGVSGFLGQHLVKALKEQGHEITALIRPTSNISHLDEYNLNYVIGNIRETSWLDSIKGADAIVHAATSKGGPWENFYEENVLSTERILKEAVKHKVKRFIFISSVVVYDHSNVKNGSSFPEDSPFEQEYTNHYSRSKIEAENLIKEFHEKEGLETVVLRPAALYGPGGLLYPARLGIAAGANGYIIVGSGKSELTLTHVRTVADAVAKSLTCEKCAGKAYNLTEDKSVSKIEYLKILKSILNPKFKIIRILFPIVKVLAFMLRKMFGIMGKAAPSRLSPQYLKLFTLSLKYPNTRAKEDLDWVPVPNVREAVKEVMEWHKDQQKPVCHHLVPEKRIVINSKKKLNVGIVGCGSFSKTHLSILKKIPNANVTALCDTNVDAAKRLSEKFGVENIYSDYLEMLDKENLDVVHVVSSAQTHAPVSIAAMKKGCHVLVEKPMAVNAEEAGEMIRTSKENNVKLCVEHSLLYDPAMIEAREILNSGAIGNIVQVESWFGTSYSSNTGSPYLRWQARNHWVYDLPGSLFQNFISHPLSVLLDIVDDVSDINVSSAYHKVVPFMKSDELRISMKSGKVLASIVLSFNATPRLCFLRLYGTKGSLTVDFMYNTTLLNKDVPMAPKVLSRNMVLKRNGRKMYFKGLSNEIKVFTGKHTLFKGNEILINLFYKSILDGTEMPVSLDNGRLSMEIMDSVWKQVDL